MNRSDLVEEITKRTGLAATDVSTVIDGLRDVSAEALRRGEKITLPGFLSVERVSRAERQGRNPQTGEAMTVPAGFSAKITPGQTLKSAAKSAANT